MSSSDNDVRIEPFLKHHINDVYELWNAIEYLDLKDDTPEGTAVFLDRNPGCCFVATRGTTVVGSILCGHDGRRGHIYHLAVAKGFRRQGIARRLVSSSMEALTNLGLLKCYSIVYTFNPLHELFWLTTGWETRKDRLVLVSKKLPVDEAS